MALGEVVPFGVVTGLYSGAFVSFRDPLCPIYQPETVRFLMPERLCWRADMDMLWEEALGLL